MTNKTMEEAIHEGQMNFEKYPELGSQASHIKMAVARWLWDEFNALAEEVNMSPDSQPGAYWEMLLKFITIVTK